MKRVSPDALENVGNGKRGRFHTTWIRGGETACRDWLDGMCVGLIGMPATGVESSDNARHWISTCVWGVVCRSSAVNTLKSSTVTGKVDGRCLLHNQSQTRSVANPRTFPSCPPLPPPKPTLNPLSCFWHPPSRRRRPPRKPALRCSAVVKRPLARSPHQLNSARWRRPATAGSQSGPAARSARPDLSTSAVAKYAVSLPFRRSCGKFGKPAGRLLH